MLIEHTSRSTQDKPKIYKCVGVFRRSRGCFNQKNFNMVSQPEMSHNPLEQPKQSTQKSTVNANSSNSKVNAAKSKSTSNLENCAKKCGLRKSKEWESFRAIWPCVDQSQHCCRNPRPKTYFLLAAISHVWREEPPRWLNQSDEERENVWGCDEWKCPPMLTNFCPSMRVCDTTVGAPNLQAELHIF